MSLRLTLLDNKKAATPKELRLCLMWYLLWDKFSNVP